MCRRACSVLRSYLLKHTITEKVQCTLTSAFLIADTPPDPSTHQFPHVKQNCCIVQLWRCQQVLQNLGIQRHLQLDAATGCRVTSTHLSPQSLRKIASVFNRALLHEISAAGPPRTVLQMATSTTENNDNSKRNGILATLQTGTNLLEHNCCW